MECIQAPNFATLYWKSCPQKHKMWKVLNVSAIYMYKNIQPTHTHTHTTHTHTHKPVFLIHFTAIHQVYLSLSYNISRSSVGTLYTKWPQTWEVLKGGKMWLFLSVSSLLYTHGHSWQFLNCTGVLTSTCTHTYTKVIQSWMQ